MAHLEFSKEITALLVIDPYNEFISARVRRPSTTGPPGSGPRKAVVVINSRVVGNPSLTRIMEGLPDTRGQTPSQHVHNLPEADLSGLGPGYYLSSSNTVPKEVPAVTAANS